jgi:cholestenol delta-isomerase
MMELPLHPYYPLGSLLSGPDFVPNTFSTLALVVVFAIGCVVILGSALLIALRINPNLKNVDRLLIMWFVLCE